MNNIKYSHRAILDLKEIKEYIILELCDEFIAKETILKITDRIKQLEYFSKVGPLLSNKIAVNIPIRYLICGNYVVFYKVDSENVIIYRIIHLRRDYMQIIFDDLLEEIKL